MISVIEEVSTLSKFRQYSLRAHSSTIGGFWFSFWRLGEAYLYNVEIDESWRGVGFGNELMTHAINEATRLGMAVIKLEVFKSNTRAISLYEKFGFIATECHVSDGKMVYTLNIGKSQ